MYEAIRAVGATISPRQPPYTLAGAFVKFLIESRGKERVLGAYSALQNASDSTGHRRNAARLVGIYGCSVDELEKRWIQAVSNTTARR